MLAFSLAVSLMINRDLSLIFLIAVPVLEAGLYFIVSRSHPYFEKVFHIYDELNSVVQENLAGIRVVKSFICLSCSLWLFVVSLLVWSKNYYSYKCINDDHRGLIKYDCLCNEYFELFDDVITSIGNDQYGKSIM